MKTTEWLRTLVLAGAMALTPTAFAGSVLVSQTGGNYAYGYGSNWTGMTSALNSAASVTVAADFTNLAQMLSFNALWLDQRGTTGSLTAGELSNLAAFIATGRRVVLMGENDNWTAWDNQILGLVGANLGGFLNGNAPQSPVVSNALTAGITSVSPVAMGLASAGGTNLFTQRFATLWGANQNVLVILDVNLWDNSGTGFSADSNAIFGQNVAAWIGQQADSVPEPATYALVGAGFALVVLARRRKTR